MENAGGEGQVTGLAVDEKAGEGAVWSTGWGGGMGLQAIKGGKAEQVDTFSDMFRLGC